MEFTARQLAQVLNGTVEGNPDARISSFGKIETAKPGQLCFYANPKYEAYVYSNKASIMLVSKDFQAKQPVTPSIIRVEDAYSAIATLLKYVADSKSKCRRHRGWCSKVSLSARLGKKVYVGDFSRIGAKSKIGSYTRIYDHVSIGEGTVIGDNCIIYPGVRIYPGMVIGNNVILHENCVIGSDGFGNAPQSDGSWKKIEHLGNVVIGNDVEVGACTTIDRAEMESTIIGNGVRIDNLCMIAHNVQIGDNTAMAAMCGIAGSTKIGKNCLLAGQVGTVGHITIADNTTLGAQSGVLGSIRKSGQTMMGSPCIPYVQFLRSYAVFKKNGAGE